MLASKRINDLSKYVTNSGAPNPTSSSITTIFIFTTLYVRYQRINLFNTFIR
jgi:hypothetical protein